QVFSGADFREVPECEFGVFLLECPWYECGESSGFILQIAQTLEVPHAMPDGFSDADHHRAGGSKSQPVGFAVHHQPFVGLAFKGTDKVADFIVENLPASSGHRIESSSSQPVKDLRHT